LVKEVAKPTDNFVSQVLLGALRRCSKEGANRLASESSAYTISARGCELLKDCRVFLTETARVKEDRTVVPLKPPLATNGGLGNRQDGESGECSKRF
jgi:hypothetical protein